jgi:hypothetical protein
MDSKLSLVDDSEVMRRWVWDRWENDEVGTQEGSRSRNDGEDSKWLKEEVEIRIVSTREKTGRTQGFRG